MSAEVDEDGPKIGERIRGREELLGTACQPMQNHHRRTAAARIEIVDTHTRFHIDDEFFESAVMKGHATRLRVVFKAKWRTFLQRYMAHAKRQDSRRPGFLKGNPQWNP